MNTQDLMASIIGHLDKYKDDPQMLSRIGLKLSQVLFTHNTEMANAELAEKQKISDYLNKLDINGKKMSVAEAEKRAVVDTNNDYGRLKAQQEAVIEAINFIKARLRVLMQERDYSHA